MDRRDIEMRMVHHGCCTRVERFKAAGKLAPEYIFRSVIHLLEVPWRCQQNAVQKHWQTYRKACTLSASGLHDVPSIGSARHGDGYQ